MIDAARPRHGTDQRPADVLDGEGAAPATEPARSPPRRPDPRGWVRRHQLLLRGVFYLALAIVVAVFVYRKRGELANIGQELDGLRWYWVLAAVGTQAVAMASLAEMQRRLFRAAGVRASFLEMNEVTLASNAVAHSLPAGVVFAEGYAFRRYTRLGASRSTAAWVELSAGALAAATLAGVVLLGLAVAGGGTGIPRADLLPAAVIVFVGAVGAAALFRDPALLARVLVSVLRVGRRVIPARAQPAITATQRTVLEVEKLEAPYRMWAGAGLLSGLNWVADAACLVFALLALGADVPWHGVLLAFAAAQLLTMLPVTPGGLGFVESGTTALLVALGLTFASASASVLIYRGVAFWLLTGVGWLAAGRLAVSDRRRRPSDRDDRSSGAATLRV
jgi:uncharacterized membrane protein YbhN (UPF0104 family)